MQVGASTGDFIFTFNKKPQLNLDKFPVEVELTNFKEHIDNLIKNHVGERITEPELRERAYRILIPFLALHSRSDLTACREAVNHFESQMKRLEPHFKKLRRKIIEERRKTFSTE